MKREQLDLSQELKVITGMIVSDQFLKEIFPIVKSKYFQTFYCSQVCEWCLEYFKEFKESPKKHIQDIYTKKRQYIRNEEELELLSTFLLRLSKNYEKEAQIGNINFSIKESIQYLKLRSLDILKSDLEEAVLNNDTERGEQCVSNYSRVEMADIDGIDILKDHVKVAQSFMYDDDVLFRFPGAMGEAVGDFLRSDLVSFLAAMKRGKTWLLIYSALTGMYFGHRTLFITLEMPAKRIINRMWRGLEGIPKTRNNNDVEIDMPYFEEIQKDMYEIKQRKELKKGLDISTIKASMKKYVRMFRRGGLVVKQLPPYSTTVDDVGRVLDNLGYYNNFVPDIVVIDYADLMSASNTRLDYRHQLDDIWKGLRELGLKREVLVLTASQTSRKGLNADTDENDTAEDIRKIAHVSKLITINSSQKERELNCFRIRTSIEREEKVHHRQALVLNCYDIGRVYVDSRFEDQVKREK